MWRPSQFNLVKSAFLALLWQTSVKQKHSFFCQKDRNSIWGTLSKLPLLPSHSKILSAEKFFKIDFPFLQKTPISFPVTFRSACWTIGLASLTFSIRILATAFQFLLRVFFIKLCKTGTLGVLSFTSKLRSSFYPSPLNWELGSETESQLCCTGLEYLTT